MSVGRAINGRYLLISLFWRPILSYVAHVVDFSHNKIKIEIKAWIENEFKVILFKIPRRIFVRFINIFHPIFV